MGKCKGKRKYAFLVGDGMADYPLDELEGMTPLEAAQTPNMDRIAACRIGIVRTIPEGMEPGSDTANLSLLGYDPGDYLTGRAPFEAASMGIRLHPGQVAFRMNLVTLDQTPAHMSRDAGMSDSEIIMLSNSSGNITNKEAELIVESLKKEIIIPGIEMYPGIAYRHILVWDKGPEDAQTIPPHDVLDQNIAPYLNHAGQNPIQELIKRSWEVLKDHAVNIERRKKGLFEANSIWLWGEGGAPSLPLFKDKFGLGGGVISAVDLLKGIGLCAGLESIYVKGATGYIDTNYIGKAEEALKRLESFDFIFLHVEAPDEASHNGSITEKIQAIEYFDQKVVGTILKGITEFEDFRIIVASDHFTPISKRTHSSEPAPFAWASKKEIESVLEGPEFSEKSAKESGVFFERGHDLMPVFLN